MLWLVIEVFEVGGVVCRVWGWFWVEVGRVYLLVVLGVGRIVFIFKFFAFYLKIFF